MADALADVLHEQKTKAEIEKERAAQRKRGTSPFTWVAFVVLSAVSAYLWIVSPDWLHPEPPEPIPMILEDAGLRMEVFNVALQVEGYRDRVGRLPNSLEEAGNPVSSVEYRQVGSSAYQLAIAGPNVRVEYSSTDSLELFLGDAEQVIRERR
jgi:hypothetical protein